MGVIVNGIVIVCSALLGMGLKTGIPQRMHQRLMQGIGLCVLAIGIDGSLASQNILIVILAMVMGTLIGEGFDIDGLVYKGVAWMESKMSQPGVGNQFSQGFISATMILCIGSMSILGSLELGMRGDNTTLYTKSILDGITAILLSSSLGVGVVFSAIPVVFFEGLIVIFASFLAPILSTAVINEIIAVGSILLIGLGLNILEITDLKILNFTPAIFLPPIIMLIM